MQGVILAGGLGTRLRPITTQMPKVMVTVNGIPFLEHQLRLLRRYCITDILVLSGYMGQCIEEYFGDGRRFGLNVQYSRERVPLGTGGGLRYAAPLLEERFLLLYGDSYLPMDYQDLCQERDSKGVKCAIAVYDNSRADSGVHNNIQLDRQGYVIQYRKQYVDDARFSHVDAGVLACRRSIVEFIPPDESVSLEESIFPLLIAQRQLFAYKTAQRFFDIGTSERLNTFKEFLSHDSHSNASSH